MEAYDEGDSGGGGGGGFFSRMRWWRGLFSNFNFVASPVTMPDNLMPHTKQTVNKFEKSGSGTSRGVKKSWKFHRISVSDFWISH